jgi:hypothetical protein
MPTPTERTVKNTLPRHQIYLWEQVLAEIFPQYVMPLLSIHDIAAFWNSKNDFLQMLFKTFMETEKCIKLHYVHSFRGICREFHKPRSDQTVDFQAAIGLLHDKVEEHPERIMGQLATFFNITTGAERNNLDSLVHVFRDVLHYSGVPSSISDQCSEFRNVQIPDPPTLQNLTRMMLQRLSPIQMQSFILFLKQLMSVEAVEALAEIFNEHPRFTASLLEPVTPEALLIPEVVNPNNLVASFSRGKVIFNEMTTLVFICLIIFGLERIWDSKGSKNNLALGVTCVTSAALYLIVGMIIYMKDVGQRLHQSRQARREGERLERFAIAPRQPKEKDPLLPRDSPA